jgi:hypothetical protein
MANEISNIPPDMQRLYRRFERWQSAHTGRLPIPERLWAAAAELARQFGAFPTAKALASGIRQAEGAVGGGGGKREEAQSETSGTSPMPDVVRHFTADFYGADGSAVGQFSQRGGGVERATGLGSAHVVLAPSGCFPR